MDENYEKEMIKAFVGKPNKPEKEIWYLDTFAKMDENTKASKGMTWKWSWFSFFFGPFFLLYRKTYLEAILYLVIIFIAGALINFIFIIAFINPQFSKIFTLVFAVLIGGYGMHFIHKTYLKKKKKIEEDFKDSESRIEAMKKSGGYHNWAILLGVIFLLFPIMVALVAPKLTPTRADAEIAMAKNEISNVIEKASEGRLQNWDIGYFTDIEGDPSSEVSSASYLFGRKRCLFFTASPEGKLTITKGADKDTQKCQKFYDADVIEKFPTIYDFSK